VKLSIRAAGVALVASTLLFTTVACSSTDESAPTAATTAEATPTDAATGIAEQESGTVVDALVSAGSFTILTELLTAAGLEEALSGPGPFTVFAPTDQAWEARASQLGVPLDDHLEDLIADPELLTDMLLYHVVPGSIPAAEVVTLDGQKVTTLSGEGWTVLVDGNTVGIEDGFGMVANVVDVDAPASNGVIHSVDRVLDGAIIGLDGSETSAQPSAKDYTPYNDTFDGVAGSTIMENLAAAGSFTVLTELLTATGLVETLSAPGEYTVFAPTDDALEATAAELGVPLDEVVKILIADPELLTDMMLYLVVPGTISAAELKTLNGQKVRNLSGEEWTVLVDGDTVSIKDGYDRTTTVIDMDVAASNGIIDVVDGLPQGADGEAD